MERDPKKRGPRGLRITVQPPRPLSVAATAEKYGVPKRVVDRITSYLASQPTRVGKKAK